MQNKLLDIVKHPPALFNCIDDGGKIIIRQHNIRRPLGHIRPRHTHGDTHIRSLQRRAIVDAIPRHGRISLAPVKRGNHARLCIRRTARNHQRKLWHGINLRIGHGIKLCGGFDERVRDFLGERAEVARDDADFFANGGCGAGVVAGEHVHFDARVCAFCNLLA